MQVLRRRRADVSLRDVTIAQDETGWQGENDVTHRKRAEDFGDFKEKLGELKLDSERGGSTLGARWGETNLRAMGAARDRGQMICLFGNIGISKFENT